MSAQQIPDSFHENDGMKFVGWSFTLANFLRAAEYQQGTDILESAAHDKEDIDDGRVDEVAKERGWRGSSETDGTRIG